MDAGKREHIQDELNRLFREWFLRAAGVGALVFLLLSPLDYLSIPERFLTFLRYRVTTALAILGLVYLTWRTQHWRLVRLWVFLAVLVSAVTIEVMILQFGGHLSPYFAGLILLAVIALGFMPAGVLYHLMLAGTIQAVYLVPILLWDQITNPRVFITENYFLFFILLSSVLVRVYNQRYLVREIGLTYDLARHQEQLESQVQERTAELRRILAEWKATLDSTGDIILLLDEHNRIVRANLATARFFNQDIRALVGVPAGALFAACGLPRVLDTVAELRRADARVEAEFTLPGTAGWFLVAAEPVLPDHGPAGGAVLSLRDITAVKRMEEERLRYQASLQQSQKMESIGTLASGIAHDFNNILQAVIGFADGAAERLPAGHAAREDLEGVVAAAERGADLVQQFLAFGRQQDLKIGPVDLNVVILQIRQMLGRVIPKQIAIEVAAAEHLPCVIADPVQIGQVLMNLIINARDAMPRGGRLIIATALVGVAEGDEAHPGVPAGEYAVVSVRDSGPGIAPEIMPRIFEPFFTTKGEGKGSGLGLATAYGIAAQHGGVLRVESAPGAGATFFVYLPVGGERPTAGAAAASPSPPGGTETVLLVDDEEVSRRLIARKLEELGYLVLEAAHGEEALQAFERRSGAVDVLLCDVVLPGMSAKDLADRLRERKPSLRVVFVSGHPEAILYQNGLLGRGDLLLSKAQGPVEIARRLRELLDCGCGD